MRAKNARENVGEINPESHFHQPIFEMHTKSEEVSGLNDPFHQQLYFNLTALFRLQFFLVSFNKMLLPQKNIKNY